VNIWTLKTAINQSWMRRETEAKDIPVTKKKTGEPDGKELLLDHGGLGCGPKMTRDFALALPAKEPGLPIGYSSCFWH